MSNPRSTGRHQREKLSWLARGRADALVSIARLQRWPTPKMYRVAESIGVPNRDLRAALERASLEVAS